MSFILTSHVIVVEFCFCFFEVEKKVTSKKQIIVLTELFLHLWALGESSGKGTRTGHVVICLADKLLDGGASQAAAILVWHWFGFFFPFHFAHFPFNALLPSSAPAFRFRGAEKPKDQRVKERSRGKRCPVPGGTCVLLKFILFFSASSFPK